MAYRSYRLSISQQPSPGDRPEAARQVVDFDGHTSLHDLHLTLQKTLKIAAAETIYAFYMSGLKGDLESEYGDPRLERRRADKALLFRVAPVVGAQFLYVPNVDFELRYSLTVVSVRETQGPLATLLPIALHLLSLWRALAELGLNRDSLEQSDPARVMLRELSAAALHLARLLRNDVQLLVALEASLKTASTSLSEEYPLTLRLFGLPLELAALGEPAEGVRIAEAFAFCAPDELNGDIALIHARAGRREEALARLEVNLATAKVRSLAEAKAGDVYRALGESDAAEVYYRRAIAEAKTLSQRDDATVQLVSFLLEIGRENEAATLMRGTHPTQPRGAPGTARVAAVGRNQPCPCGSGKKYKKCHG